MQWVRRLERARDLVLPLSIPGYAATSIVLAVASPFLMLRSAYVFSAVALHLFFGVFILFGNLYFTPPRSPWPARSLLVAWTTYALGLATFALRGDLQCPFYMSWLIMMFSFPLLVARVEWAAALRRFRRWIPYRHLPLLLLALGLLIRLPFYFMPVRLSLDFNAYSFFGNRIEQGAVPYRDVFIPYTPGFVLILQAVAGFHMVPALRAILALPDLLLILLFARGPGTREVRLKRAAAWALFPLAILEIAWSAHFDGMVAVLVLVGSVHLARHPILSGACLAFAASARLPSLGALPSALLRQESLKAALAFVLSAVLTALSLLLLFLGQIGSVVGNSVNYQISRGSYNSLAFFLTWFGVGGGSGSGVSTFEFPFSFSGLGFGWAYVSGGILLVVNLAVMLRWKRDQRSVRWYGTIIGLTLSAWGLLIATFPLTFAEEVPVSPGWPYYRPTVFHFAFGIMTMLTGILLAREWFCLPELGKKMARRRLMFLNLIAFVIVIPIYYSWYLLWFAPVLLLLLPRRVGVIGLVACMALAPTAYYASDFNGEGSDRLHVEVPAGAFQITVVEPLAGGPVPRATYQLEAGRGALGLSGKGSMTVFAAVNLTTQHWQVLTVTVWSDVETISWDKLRIWMWIQGHDASSPQLVDYIVIGDEAALLTTGRAYHFNLAYTQMTEITGIKVRFDNLDSSPHRIWIGKMLAFNEYQ